MEEMKIARLVLLNNFLISVNFFHINSKDNEITTQAKEDLGENIT